MNTAEILILIMVAISLAMSALTLLLVLKGKGGGNSALSDKNEDFITDQLKGVCDVNKSAIDNACNTIVTVLNSSNQQKITSEEINAKRLTDTVDRLINEQKSGFSTLENHLNAQLINIKTDMVKSLDSQSTSTKQDSQSLRESLSNRMNELIRDVNTQMDKLRNDNDIKLAQMRNTVEEKLQSTLNERITASFKIINDQLDSVHKGLGQMQSIGDNVVNLNRVLSGVKSRGMWGEVSLKSLLEQILTEKQYSEQVTIKGQTKVDFAVVLPGNDDKNPILLPIDAKFPYDVYERLVTASENCDKLALDLARKELKQAIKTQARSIQEKYVQPPKTTNFAIMYLPIEGLYAEVVRDVDLMADLQNNFRITPSGPTTLSALLNALQLGFHTLTVQKSSAEVWKILASFRKDLEKYLGLLEKTRKSAGEISDNMDGAIKRTGMINDKLSKIEGVSALLEGENNEV